MNINLDLAFTPESLAKASAKADRMVAIFDSISNQEDRQFIQTQMAEIALHNILLEAELKALKDQLAEQSKPSNN